MAKIAYVLNEWSILQKNLAQVPSSLVAVEEYVIQVVAPPEVLKVLPVPVDHLGGRRVRAGRVTDRAARRRIRRSGTGSGFGHRRSLTNVT